MNEPHLDTQPHIFNPNPRTIVMVRHGETEGNIDDKAQGHFDAQLTERGRLQAQAVAKRLADVQFDAVYSSDLRRAMDTAKTITANRTELKIRPRPQLREYNFGDFEDFLWDDIGNAVPEVYQRWKNLDTRHTIEFPGGESMGNAWQRVGDFVSEMLNTHRQGNETLLVVGHGGSLQALLGQLLNLRIRDQWDFVFTNTGVTILDEHLYTPNGWRMKTFNDTSHLNGIGFAQ